MAGRNHHFIPQLLQKGFSAGQTRRGQDQVWVFRRNQKPFATSTRNSFVERDFYGPPATGSLDDDITALEPTLNRFLEEARARSATYLSERSEEAVTVVWHIASRARWMRDFYTVFARIGLARMSNALSKRAELPSVFHNLIARETRELLDTMLKDAANTTDRILTAEESALAAQLDAAIEGNPGVLADAMNPKEVGAFARGMQKDALLAATRAQNHFLKHHLIAKDTPMRRHLESMRWRIVVQETPDYILGDCGPLLLATSGEPLGPMGTQVFKGFSAIALPISSMHCLLGSHDIAAAVFNTAALNECAAAWSSEAFIACADNERNRRLHTLINSRIEPYLSAELESTFQEMGL